MIITNRLILENFTRKHADAMKPIAKWLVEVENAQWTSFVDVKNTFRSVDYVGNDRVVFDIKGDHYRFVTIIIFMDGVINIRWAGTHGEYDKIKDCSIL
jgi:mRNA interferase HigB